MTRLWDRRRTVLALGASMAGAACASPRDGRRVLVNLAGLQPPTPPPSDGAVLAAEADTARRMTAPVFLNGAGPYAFVVDTGANRSVLAAEVAARIGAPGAGDAEIHGIAGAEPAPLALINRLSVGAVSSRRVRMPLLAQSRLGAQGLLGVDVLRNRRVELDFEHNELRIDDSRRPVLPPIVAPAGGRIPVTEDAGVVTVAARQRFGQLIIIDADVGGQPVTAFLDSGSQNTVGNLALRRAVVSADPGRPVQSIEVMLVSATGQSARGELSPLPALRMGGLRIGGLSAVFADLHVFRIWDLEEQPAILIGVDILRHFRSVALDFGRRTVTFRAGRALNPAAAGP
ncbi:retroviral-like aspartic protease family protein [Phenylobacterium sp.]|uniref:retroviral-like aspartic protease family protein n=1 Tax=Phenylobacterium sp. TaxID=1871053 RepID=UPI002735EDB7|nr:retroviral-like aspartic protease family protein [Phenylobacterium sp.]MDP3659631.1 retroviral-like aspartic protease family protein [Phenylobacterium sp.]